MYNNESKIQFFHNTFSNIVTTSFPKTVINFTITISNTPKLLNYCPKNGLKRCDMKKCRFVMHVKKLEEDLHKTCVDVEKVYGFMWTV